LGFRDMQIPTAATTMTSEDLYLLSDNEKGLLRLSVSKRRSAFVCNVMCDQRLGT